MRVALCTKKNTLSQIWKSDLHKGEFKRHICENEDELYSYLAQHKDESIIVCLEDAWAGKSLQELREMILATVSWYPKSKIFVLSQLPTFNTGKLLLSLEMKDYGHIVRGYGNARMLGLHLNEALECIARGDVWVYPEFVQMMIQNIKHQNDLVNVDTLDVLTPREKEIAQLMCDGYTNKEIADSCSISLSTVKAHASAIYEKLDVKDRLSLVLKLKED